jgi:hypothetical protein
VYACVAVEQADETGEHIAYVCYSGTERSRHGDASILHMYVITVMDGWNET